MYSRFLDALAIGAVALAAAAPGAFAHELRVCADPDDLPYSSEDERGFENRIVRLVARDLGADVRYYWQRQWRGFARKTLLAHHCDVIPGVPAALPDVLATVPYYRGTYAFVYREDRAPGLRSLDDPRLRSLRVGLQLVGIDAIATPAGAALAARGITQNVVGFPVLGDEPSAQRIVDALGAGTLDVAIVWSPQAGYFAGLRHLPLRIVPIEGAPGDPPLAFPIAMGVRPDDAELKHALDAALARLRPQIDAVLRDYAVTRTDVASSRPSPR